jgi:hypothetical protein
MRANRVAALNDQYTVDFEDPPACGAPDIDGTVPEQDIAAWRMSLACRLPQSSGAVARNGNEFTFTIRWDDSHGQDDPMLFEFTTAL